MPPSVKSIRRKVNRARDQLSEAVENPSSDARALRRLAANLLCALNQQEQAAKTTGNEGS